MLYAARWMQHICNSYTCGYACVYTDAHTDSDSDYNADNYTVSYTRAYQYANSGSRFPPNEMGNVACRSN